LESGERRPTLELLLPLARAYGVTLDELVDAPATGDPRIHLRPVKAHGMTMLPLTRRAGGIQAYKLVIPAGKPQQKQELATHEGYEWVYVLNGRLRLRLAEHDLVLSPGEAAEFDTRTPHWFGAADAGGVEFLSLFGKQGERAHLRLRPKRGSSAPPTSKDRPGDAGCVTGPALFVRVALCAEALPTWQRSPHRPSPGTSR
jgi:transcriptional regulator with XRE-family HTH domain